MNKDTERYAIGWSDPKQFYTQPEDLCRVEYFISDSWWFKFKLTLAYIVLALSLTMVAVPMAWVNFFRWVLA